MATVFGLKLFSLPPASAPAAQGSLLATFNEMVESGELDSCDAEERFQEVLARARSESRLAADG